MDGLPGLEAEYQNYKHRVNFVWMYGREAHPDQRLEWAVHGYDPNLDSTEVDRTTTMEERAHRAWLLKNGKTPNLEIPMIIDFINTNMGSDDQIRRTYGGNNHNGAPNTGYIIDCDGTVLVVEHWAWAENTAVASAPVEELVSFLDNYLTSPPACYAGSSDGGVEPDGGGSPDGGVTPDGGGQADETCGTDPKVNDDTHYGWTRQDCSECHNLPPNDCHSAEHPADCAVCHGGNGATCPPEGEQAEREHLPADNCQSCHPQEHSFTENNHCTSCHYAPSGVTGCEDSDDPQDSPRGSACGPVGGFGGQAESCSLVFVFVFLSLAFARMPRGLPRGGMAR